MSERSSRPTGRLSRNAELALGLFCAVVIAYSFVIAGQILLGVLVCGVVWTAAVGYRLVDAFFRFVDATERIAAALESNAGIDRPTRTDEFGRPPARDRADDSATSPRGGSTDGRSRDHVQDRW